MGRFKDYLSEGPRDYRDFVEKLSGAIHGKAELKTLGMVEGKDIYLVTINPKAKKTIFFLGGIHGNEPGGPLATLKWLEDASVPEDIRVFLIPCANPHGFERDVRTNSSREDQNRRWCDDYLRGENKLIRDGVIADNKIDFLHTLHEDPSAKEFYLYYSDEGNRPFYERIVKKASEFFPVSKSDTVRGRYAREGMIPHSKLDMASKRDRCAIETHFKENLGAEYLTTEPPGQTPLKDRVEFLAQVMKMVVRFAIR
jgi:hypothetical protein